GCGRWRRCCRSCRTPRSWRPDRRCGASTCPERCRWASSVTPASGPKCRNRRHLGRYVGTAAGRGRALAHLGATNDSSRPPLVRGGLRGGAVVTGYSSLPPVLLAADAFAVAFLTPARNVDCPALFEPESAEVSPAVVAGVALLPSLRSVPPLAFLAESSSRPSSPSVAAAGSSDSVAPVVASSVATVVGTPSTAADFLGSPATGFSTAVDSSVVRLTVLKFSPGTLVTAAT